MTAEEAREYVLTVLPKLHNLPRILLIGDTIIDRNVECHVLGISAETPTLVIEEESITETEGGAACVLRNLDALGLTVAFITGTRCRVKTRYWVGTHKLLQVDGWQSDDSNSKFDNRACWPRLISLLVDDSVRQPRLLQAAHIGAVVISDYRHGFMTQDIATNIVSAAQGANVATYLDSQVSQGESNHQWYGGVDVMFLNERECDAIDDTHDGWHMAHRFVIKRGAGESQVFSPGENRIKEPAITIDPVDTCGAGDAFLAAFVTAELAGLDQHEVLRFANAWAGLSCLVKGANPPDIGNKDKEKKQ